MRKTQPVIIEAPCEHVASVTVHDVDRPATGCEDCLATGGRWLHLRICLTCGHVGCCDSSPNKHATRHYHTTTHPIITSGEPGETWVWCYVDEEALAS